jgi:hypothetical protein
MCHVSNVDRHHCPGLVLAGDDCRQCRSGRYFGDPWPFRSAKTAIKFSSFGPKLSSAHTHSPWKRFNGHVAPNHEQSTSLLDLWLWPHVSEGSTEHPNSRYYVFHIVGTLGPRNYWDDDCTIRFYLIKKRKPTLQRIWKVGLIPIHSS